MSHGQPEGVSSGVHQWGGSGHLRHLFIYLPFDAPSFQGTFLLPAALFLPNPP